MYIPDNTEVRDLEDRRTRILIDRNDDLRILHTSQMLDCARDAARDIQVRTDRLTGLADLTVFDVPLLLISAYDWSEIEENARGAGISGFISKPLFKSTLFYGLKKFVDPLWQAQEDTLESSEHFSGRHILLAEDNDLNWEIAEELLSDLGLELQRAENGQECVELFQKSPLGFYDAILMDIRMPVMTGYQASEAIRALERSDSNLPIIAMTADAFSEDIKKCLDSGMNAHVAKPIDVDEVAHLLKKYMKHSQST